jgi:hypothetical protein
MAKSFLISGGTNEVFKEFVGFCAQWMLLQSNPTAVTKVRGSLIIASWENRHLDWATITSTALVREVTASEEPGHGIGVLVGDDLQTPSGHGTAKQPAEGDGGASGTRGRQRRSAGQTTSGAGGS